MITDNVGNIMQYQGLSDRIDKALEYLKNTDLKAMEVGRYELDGSDLFVLIQAYEPKAEAEGRCEAHKKYIDIQYIIEGSEKMGYGDVTTMEVIDPYDEAKDRFFVEYTGDYLRYKQNDFAIFFPHDAHMPGISDGQCSSVKKAVVKIRV